MSRAMDEHAKVRAARRLQCDWSIVRWSLRKSPRVPSKLPESGSPSTMDANKKGVCKRKRLQHHNDSGASWLRSRPAPMGRLRPQLPR